MIWYLNIGRIVVFELFGNKGNDKVLKFGLKMFFIFLGY